MRIALDVMGGDYAPEACLEGAVNAQKKILAKAKIVLIGDSKIINEKLSQKKSFAIDFEIIHSDEVITMHDSPTRAIQQKPKSSVSIGFQLLKEKKIDAFISAGNSGAMLVGCVMILGPIEGVLRPTIGTLYPSKNGFTYILDVGLNADCKPEHLVQFAEMGNIFAKHIMKIENPKIALLSIGEEKSKGNILTVETHNLLKENKHLNFIGNVEGRDLLPGKAHVVVCEGFTGNVVIKLSESFYEVLKETNAEKKILDRFNFEWYGGVPVLGVNGIVIIGHGISGPLAFENMIKNSMEMCEADINEKIRSVFQNPSADG